MHKIYITVFALGLLILGCGNPKPENKEATPAAEATSAQDSKKIILFFGDSLTAGYGLDDQSDSFPGVIAAKIDSLKLPYMVKNAGVSGETSAGGLARIDWILKQPVDVFMLELGANDGLRGIPVTETRKNLQAIISKVKSKYPKAKIVLLGMQVPPSMGTSYANDFKGMFPALAKTNDIGLVEFLLEGVGGNPELNQQDGIHPTKAGAKILAQNVWEVLEPQL
jgi:acyl-CoA thioesterase I